MNNPYPKKSLNAVIWDSLYYYPMLYQTGGDVLQFLFCVIGNGYDWNKGRLEHADTERDEDDIYRKPTELRVDNQELKVRFEIDRLRGNAGMKFTRENAKMLTLDIHRDWLDLYPLSGYSGLANIPDDIQDDFLAGARVAIDSAYGLLMTGGSLSYRTYKNKKNRDDRTLACIEIADESLASINKRFGPNPIGVESNGYQLWKNFAGYCKFMRESSAEQSRMLRSILDEVEA